MKNLIIVFALLISIYSNAEKNIEFLDIDIPLKCYYSNYTHGNNGEIIITDYYGYYIIVKHVSNIGGDMSINDLYSYQMVGLQLVGQEDDLRIYLITSDIAKFSMQFSISPSDLQAANSNTFMFSYEIGKFFGDSRYFEDTEQIYSNVSVETPTITIDENVCYSPVNLSISNLPSEATYVTWTSSNNIVFLNGNTGTQIDIEALNSTTNGQGWVQPTVHMASCNNFVIPAKQTWVGTKPLTISEAYDPVCYCTVANVYTGINYNFWALNGSSQNNTDYSWIIDPPEGDRDLFPYMASGENITFSSMSPGTYTFKLKYNGECGWSPETIKYFDFEGDDGFMMLMSPVPATTELTIEIIELENTPKISINEEVTVELYDKFAQLKKQKRAKSKMFKINISDLSPSVYIVKVKKGNIVKTKQIVVE